MTPQSSTQDLGLVAGIIRSPTPPTELEVIWYNTVERKQYYYDFDNREWVLLINGGGGSGKLKQDIAVSLSNGKTMGAIKNGDLIPAGTLFEDLLNQALVESIYPSYNPATLVLSQSAAPVGEIGESVENILTATFTRNDAGALTAISINKDGVRLGAIGNASPLQRTVTVARTSAPIVFTSSANYGAGAPKDVPPQNQPDERPAAVRNPNAPQAAENNFASNSVALYGYIMVFFGPVSAIPANSNAVRNLIGKQLTNAGNQFILNTGTTERIFVAVLPPGTSITNVTDMDNQSANITAAYRNRGTIDVADAGGTIRQHPIYSFTANSPYLASARHLVSYV